MELFDKKFVYLEWDDKLEGKEVFVADCLANLRRRVDNNDHHGYSECVVDSCVEFPFRVSSGITFAMAYYDPLYKYKLAYNQGKKVEVFGFVGISRAWIEVTDDWKWEENYEYRVKPEEPAVIPEMWTACIDDEGVVSIMPACEWNKDKGRQLIEGTEEKCKDYAVENYFKKCVHEVSICCSSRLGCQGFKKLDKSEEYKEAQVCSTCKYKDLPYSCSPCNECMENSVNAGEERSMWEPREHKKKRRKTNRELAQWLAQGNGQVKYRDGYYPLISCTAYDIRDDNKPCPDYYVVRGWNETEWHEPEVEE